MGMTLEKLRELGFDVVGGKAVRLQPATAPTPAPAIRIPARPAPNATETRCFNEYLPKHWPGLRYVFAAHKFVLPSGTVYTPDWTCWDGATLIACVEVKGAHIHNARSAEAFKAALVAFPHHTWAFAQWKNKTWLDTIVRPAIP